MINKHQIKASKTSLKRRNNNKKPKQPRKNRMKDNDNIFSKRGRWN